MKLESEFKLLQQPWDYLLPWSLIASVECNISVIQLGNFLPFGPLFKVQLVKEKIAQRFNNTLKETILKFYSYKA